MSTMLDFIGTRIDMEKNHFSVILYWFRVIKINEASLLNNNNRNRGAHKRL